MLYTLFFSRLRELSSGEAAEYQERAAHLKERAVTEHPGFVDMKSYVAEDGERLTVVRFRDAEAQRGWRLDPLHRESQARGRSDWYERYRIVVCEEVRVHGFTHTSEAG